MSWFQLKKNEPSSVFSWKMKFKNRKLTDFSWNSKCEKSRLLNLFLIKSSTHGSKKLIEDPAIRAWLCCLPIYELAGRLKKSTCLNLLSRNTSAALQIKSSHYYKLRKPSRLCNPFYCFQMKPFGSFLSKFPVLWPFASRQFQDKDE